MLRASTESLEDLFLIGGLITVQIIYAIFGVFMAHLLFIGLNPLFLVVYGSLATSILLAPIAFFVEKSRRPRKFNPLLLINFCLMGLGGVTAFQWLMLVGMNKTSPAIASAMPNLAPGLIFIIAGCIGMEKVEVKSNYGRAKVLGTMVCLSGALVMSFIRGPALSHALTVPGKVFLGAPASEGLDTERFKGCMYLLAGVLVLSCTIILQAATLAKFPAPISLCSITSLIGSILTAILELTQERKLDVDTSRMNSPQLFGCALLGGFVHGVCIAFQAWTVKKRGPVLVSMFSPIGTVCAALLSFLTLGEPICLGSVTGMFFMFIGLYFVLWAKKNEGYHVVEDHQNLKSTVTDTRKPLLG